jgi:GDPmannose 4,6-dehydratase
MYGSTPPPQHERTPFQPRSPYACAKVFAHQLCQNYRDAYGMFIACGILFNHESPRRGIPFVTRKITRTAARIKHGLDRKLYLGNLDALRDWGFAGDYVDAMTRMLAIDEPLDLEIGTGITHTLDQLLSTAFAAVGIADPAPYVVADPDLVRPADSKVLVADPEPAAGALGWRSTTTFDDLVRHMVGVHQERLRTGVEHDARYL